MRNESVAIRALLPALALLALPSVAGAQETVAHRSVYTVNRVEDLLATMPTARTYLPSVDPKVLPRSSLLRNNALPPKGYAPVPGAAPGSSDGVTPNALPGGGVSSDAYGTVSPQSIAPYSMARASAIVLGSTPNASAVAVTSYPWRAAGKLSFFIGASQYVCSASMIKPGLLITAAHCVFQFGANSASGYHTNFLFAPGQYDSGATPYGTWTATSERIPASYYNGTDTCTTAGVVCNNDIAIITMAPNGAGKLPGTVVGFFGYGWNGYSYTASFGGASLASITQLGYPVAFDSGYKMERNDGVGSYWNSGNLKNTVLGSAMTGGSSGGPWMVNFGAPPTVGAGGSLGISANAQTVVGVTSWGYTAVGANTQGASWFGVNVQFPKASYLDSHGVNRGAGNIGSLVAAACTANFDRC